MKYVKPHYYDEFQCTAGRCPDTCCGGWKIAIDEESLWYYSRVTGPFGNRLYASIDWEEGAFCQNQGKCSLLNDQRLCQLYMELGEEAMCDACRRYPRHEEEFKGERELSLSLSCPVAAEMILACKEPLRLLEWETPKEEELAEEFETFDEELYTRLQAARTVIFKILQDHSRTVQDRSLLMLRLAGSLQECLDKEQYGNMDRIIDVCRKDSAFFKEQVAGGQEARYIRMCRDYTVFRRLEPLREEWADMLSDAWTVLYERGEAAYMEICREFENQWEEKASQWEEWSLFTENLLLFFIYTYFCGAVYDGWIYSKAALAEFSVRWIQELAMARWAADKTISVREAYIETAYRYAREIEHSDENLNILEEWLAENIPAPVQPEKEIREEKEI